MFVTSLWQLTCSLLPIFISNTAAHPILEDRSVSLNTSLPTNPPWPSAIISWAYQTSAVEAEISNSFDLARSRWTAKLPWLTFKQLPTGSTNHTNGALVVRFGGCNECSTWYGYQPSRPHDFVVGSGGAPRDPLCSRSTCPPEDMVRILGQALGLLYEENRPDRDRYVKIQDKNVDPGCKDKMPKGVTCADTSQIPAGCCEDLKWFYKYAANETDWRGTKYDVGSVMQHYRYWKSIGDGYPTIVGVGGTEVPEFAAGMPSEGDARRVCKLFGTFCPQGGEGWQEEGEGEGGW